MITDNLRIAIHSLRGTRVRSLLTTLGVVIGVASVVLAVNIGQGVRKQVTGQIEDLGGNLISIKSGRVVTRDDQGEIVKYNLNQALSSASLTDADLQAIAAEPNIETVVPLAEVNAGISTTTGLELLDGSVIGTTPQATDLLGREIVFGSIFSDFDRSRTAVLGSAVAEDLYGDPSPIGRIIKIRGSDFIIKGVFDKFPASPLTIGSDYNRTVFIPYDALADIGYTDTNIKEILVKATPGQVDQTIDILSSQLLAAHGQNDFSVLKQSDLVFITDDIFNLITSMVAAVAAISLIVGGIGIMNIMLVGVAERTREIGIRKAIGASNLHIMMQFMTESILLSILGGFIGVVVAIVGGLIVRSLTTIKPAFSIEVVLIAIGSSALVGIIFGVGPAYKAARKRPIDALRS